MRKSIRRTSHRKKSVSDKYSRKSRITKTARNKNRSRNHKKSRKQMYVGGGCGASSAAGGDWSKEVRDWWYQSEERNSEGFYDWIKMGLSETLKMNRKYYDWARIRNEQIMKQYSFVLKMNDSSHGVHGDVVHINFYHGEMTHTLTGFTRKIESTTRRCEGVPPVLPIRINTAPFIKSVDVQPSFDAFGKPLVSPVQYPQGSAASSPLTSADNVTWLWQSDDGYSWKKFSTKDSEILENAYQNRTDEPIIHPTIPWKFEFNPMRQTNLKTGSTRAIYRQVIPATVLPEGWERRFDNTLNKEFFYNTITKDISWSRPT